MEYNTFFKDKSLDEILELMSSNVCELYLADDISGTLSVPDMVKVINKHGLIENLILFHLNEIKLEDKELIKLIFADNQILDRLPYFNKSNLLTLYNNLPKSYDLDLVKNVVSAIANNPDTTSNEFNKILSEYHNILLDSDNIVDIELEIKSIWLIYKNAQCNIQNTLDALNYIAQYVDISYEQYDDYLIAYKGVTASYTSTICDKIKYLPGNKYKTHTDNNIFNENSFGLSVWDYQHAKDFYFSKVLKVKIYYKDISYVDLLDGKIRAKEIEVLEEV